MQSAKTKVETAVKEYRRLFPIEYQAFLDSTRKKTDNLDTRWAEVKGAEHQIVRALFDMPEVLYHSIVQLLTDDEADWLFSRNAYKNQPAGLSWFIRKFPQFKITEDF